MSRPFLFNWKIALFSGIFFVVFLLLGFWQLERATEKEHFIASAKSRHARTPVSIAEAPKIQAELQGLPIVLEGQYKPGKFFLLDNRVLKGKVGFELLLPFQVKGGPLVMVNRGFVAMAGTRNETPNIPALKNGTMAEGHIHVIQEGRFSLQEDLSEVTRWPRIVQKGNPQVLETLLGEVLYPYVLRLQLADPNALPRNWPTTVMLPAKHKGYAIQWFAMAVTVFIAFVCFSFRKPGD